jgi:digeranylgeranylglycerophospholipid reductase
VEKTDILVVGAGPVGLYLAGLLEKSGLSVTVLEEHDSIGRPNHCSGLVSRNIGLFVRPRSEWVEHEVSGSVIKCGSSLVQLKKPRTAAYVIDRPRFDLSLSEGLDVRLGTRVEGVSAGEEGITLKTNNGVLKAQMLLGCDGANSVVARHFGSRPKKLLMGVIGITKQENHSKDVEIIIDKKASPDGFFWKIPRGRTTEYGMFSSKADFLDLESFFSVKPAERRAGLIPIGPGKSYFERTLLVGDAAGMSKPWSGGGIIYGFMAAKIAARTVLEAFEWKDFSEGFLERYEKCWKNAFGRQIQTGMFGRRIFEGAGDFEIQMALKAMSIFSPLLNGMDMDFLA